MGCLWRRFPRKFWLGNMNTIVVYTDEIDEKLKNNVIQNFIYDSFTMVVTKNEYSNIASIFDIATNQGNPNECSCRVTMLNESTGNYEVATEFNWLITDEKIETIYRYENDNDIFGDVSCDWADYLYSVMSYIMTTPREKVKKTINKEIDLKERKENRKYDYKENKIHLLSEIVEYVKENGLTTKPVGTREIQCPCWSVRGHYRHYKNGNVVFIKNYEKGKEKGKTKPKDKIYTV